MSEEVASVAVVRRVVRSMAQTAVDNEAHFSSLDAVVGDGDFGFSLARGFEKVLAELDGITPPDAAAFLKRVAMIITSRCGGTSGPIWGTAFLRAAAAAAEREPLSSRDVAGVLRAAFLGIQQRGGAALGEKTLLDALGPFIERFEAELEASGDWQRALDAAAAAADSAARATADLVAKRGRASYTGERSRGSVDPGATALALMAQNVCVALRQRG